MKVTGIIAEYNPFHNGHLYHLKEARRLTGADFLVVVMSGDFVQRGTPAIADKFARAEMALSCGADLVIELPVQYATGSAEYFAEGAVALLNSLGPVDSLCFGSECADLDLLEKTAEILAEEPPAYRKALQRYLKEGHSFPSAREKALREHGCSQATAHTAATGLPMPGSGDAEDCAATASVSTEAPTALPEGLLSRPNNILALEYLKALRRTGSSIKPVAVPRLGDYHAAVLKDPEGFASASAIRNALKEGCPVQELSAFLPGNVVPILSRALEEKPQPCLNDYSQIFRYLLLCAGSAQDLSVYQDVTPDLGNRIFSLRGQYRDLESFAQLSKSKQYTYSRIVRCLTHILLRLKSADVEQARRNGWHSYIRVLGFRKESVKLLSSINKESALPLVIRLSDAPGKLPENSWKMLQRDLLASSVYHMTDPILSGREGWSEFTRPVVRV